MSISVDIEKKLGNFHLNIQFECEQETLALLGASGCGKSMTLKCIAGIERPDRGKIVVDGTTLFDSKHHIDLPQQKRNIGLLFQNYALFPNMTVEQNILAGACREPDKKKHAQKVRQIMERFGLSSLASHYPCQLSGGQQQRTALARILVANPSVLLLDEPFSALDRHLRFQLEQEVRQIIREFGKTVLMVSHDEGEVFRMADSVAILDEGSIQAIGPKKTIFSAPETIQSARLTGCKNISPVKIIGQNRALALEWNIPLQSLSHSKNFSSIGIRAHDICLGPGENSFFGRVVEEMENPFSYSLMLLPQGATNPIVCEVDKDTWRAQRASEVEAHIPSQAILWLKD